MKAIFKIVLAVASASSLSACISMKSYVDPQYHHATYETVHRLVQPVPVKVSAEFLANGKPKLAVDRTLQNQVEQILRASGVFSPSTDPGVTSAIRVSANNIADMAAARAKGFGTGLTFGAAGSMVDDNYEFQFTWHGGSANDYQATYKHAIHTTVGNARGPAGLTPTTPVDAFNQVVQDLTLDFVEALQEKGLVAK